MAGNPRYGWVVITTELFRDRDVAALPVKDRWAYLEGLTEDAKAGRARELHPEHGCGVILRQRRRFSDRDRNSIFARDNWRCRFCADADELVLDHVIPLARGGADALTNLQTLCAPCNRKKWAHLP